jgi:hypothetical protein
MSIINFLQRTFGRMPAARAAPPPRKLPVGRPSNPAEHITPDFLQLNVDWNAEPNAPGPRATPSTSDILLTFDLNAFVHKQFVDGERGTLRFTNCSRYRLGGTNDEGWCLGQCRYSRIAPRRGEFYELVGDDPLRDQPSDWRAAGGSGAGRHFRFYFRDGTFECFAGDWLIEIDDANPLHRVVGNVTR